MIQSTNFTKPFYIFFLMLPTGISNGFITVVLPYLLTKNGMPVAVTAGIVAIGVSANLWRFLWGPVIDISLTLHKWFWLGLLACTASLMLLCFIPFTNEGATLLSLVVFVSQVGATIILLPINGFMANRIEEKKKGIASGWYQAGSLAGTGFGGGIGLWLATNYNIYVSGGVLCLASIFFALIVLLIKDIPSNTERAIGEELKSMGKDVFAMLKVPAALFVMILVLMPIGTGAMANLWSAVSLDWKTDVETVALVTGILSGIVSALGCVVGGVIADRFGVWVAYLGSGTLCAIVTIAMALMPMEPYVYIGGVLAYAFSMGLIYAAFTAVILYAIGKKHVATKFSLIASLGNLPVVYITSMNGWVHDKYSSRIMLTAEAIVGIIFVLIFYIILKRMMYKKLIPITIE